MASDFYILDAFLAYVCIYICKYKYICIRMYVHTYVHVYTYVCMDLCSIYNIDHHSSYEHSIRLLYQEVLIYIINTTQYAIIMLA